MKRRITKRNDSIDLYFVLNIIVSHKQKQTRRKHQ